MAKRREAIRATKIALGECRGKYGRNRKKVEACQTGVAFGISRYRILVRHG